MTRFSRPVVLVALALAFAMPVFGYNVVNTTMPAVNCIFSVNCIVVVGHDMDSFPFQGARVQSRYSQGEPGSIAAGKWLYEYRIDLTGTTPVNWVSQMSIDGWGPLRQYDYNFDSVATDHVYNVVAGGIGTKSVTSAYSGPDTIYFTFGTPIYSRNITPGGESSYFFGLVSDYPPIVKPAGINTNIGWYTMNVYAPRVPQ